MGCLLLRFVSEVVALLGFFFREANLIVRVSENESIEKALKRFKKQVQKAAILSDYKRKRYFESASEKRRRKAAAAAQRRKKKRHRRY